MRASPPVLAERAPLPLVPAESVITVSVELYCHTPIGASEGRIRVVGNSSGPRSPPAPSCCSAASMRPPPRGFPPMRTTTDLLEPCTRRVRGELYSHSPTGAFAGHTAASAASDRRERLRLSGVDGDALGQAEHRGAGSEYVEASGPQAGACRAQSRDRALRLHVLPRALQNVPAVDLVVERMETSLGVGLAPDRACAHRLPRHASSMRTCRASWAASFGAVHGLGLHGLPTSADDRPKEGSVCLLASQFASAGLAGTNQRRSAGTTAAGSLSPQHTNSPESRTAQLNAPPALTER